MGDIRDIMPIHTTSTALRFLATQDSLTAMELAMEATLTDAKYNLVSLPTIRTHTTQAAQRSHATQDTQTAMGQETEQMATVANCIRDKHAHTAE